MPANPRSILYQQMVAQTVKPPKPNKKPPKPKMPKVPSYGG